MKCFLSCHAADRAWAEWITWHLEGAGHSVWSDRPFTPGVNGQINLDHAVHEADILIRVLSPHFEQSPWTREEVHRFLMANPAGRVLTVQVSPTSPGLSNAGDVVLNLTGVSEREALGRLLAAVHAPSRCDQAHPPFPGMPWAPAPDEPPQIWYMPARDPHFVGRSEALHAVQIALADDAQPIVMLTGESGIGKTSVSVEYAYQQASAYDLVWWIDAQEPLTMALQAAQLAAAQGFGDTVVQPAASELVHRWLSQHDRWLIILDGLNEAESLPAFLPHDGAGHVLITARRRPRVVGGIELPVLPLRPDEAEEYLWKRAPAIGHGTEALARDLAYHPLALGLAAAFIQETGLSIGQLRQSLQQHTPVGQETPVPVDQMWQCMHHWLPVGLLELIERLAYMSSSAVQPLLLQSGDARDKLARKELNHTVSLLRRWSLATTGSGSIYMSAALQAAIRGKAEADKEQSPAHAAVHALTNAWRTAVLSMNDETAIASLLPHVLAVARHTERLHSADERTAFLLNLAGMHLLEQNVSGSARKLFVRALNHLPDTPEVAITRAAIQYNYGSAMLRDGDVADADRQFQAVVAGAGENRELLAPAWIGLGLTAEREERLEDARYAFQRALHYESPGAGTVGILRSLARIHADLDDWPEALQTLEDARLLAPEDISLVTEQVALLIQMQEYKRAMARLEDGLVCVPPDNIRAITMREGLADLALKLEKPADALRYYEDALRVADAQLAPEHPQVRQLKASIQELKGRAMP